MEATADADDGGASLSSILGRCFFPLIRPRFRPYLSFVSSPAMLDLARLHAQDFAARPRGREQDQPFPVRSRPSDQIPSCSVVGNQAVTTFAAIHPCQALWLMLHGKPLDAGDRGTWTYAEHSMAAKGSKRARVRGRDGNVDGDDWVLIPLPVLILRRGERVGDPNADDRGLPDLTLLKNSKQLLALIIDQASIPTTRPGSLIRDLWDDLEWSIASHQPVDHLVAHLSTRTVSTEQQPFHTFTILPTPSNQSAVRHPAFPHVPNICADLDMPDRRLLAGNLDRGRDVKRARRLGSRTDQIPISVTQSLARLGRHETRIADFPVVSGDDLSDPRFLIEHFLRSRQTNSTPQMPNESPPVPEPIVIRSRNIPTDTRPTKAETGLRNFRAMGGTMTNRTFNKLSKLGTWAADEELDLCDTLRNNAEVKMTGKEAEAHFAGLTKTSLPSCMNLISFQFDHLTDMSSKIGLPRVVEALSWERRFWEKPMGSFFYTQSDKGAATSWHVDFAGTSVCMVVLEGHKRVRFVQPTLENIRRCEKALDGASIPCEFTASDMVAVDLMAGDMLIIPGGWPHAVHTLAPTRMFSSNFLTEYNIPMQIQAWTIQANAGFRNMLNLSLNYKAMTDFLQHMERFAYLRETVKDHVFHPHLLCDAVLLADFVASHAQALSLEESHTDLSASSILAQCRRLQTLAAILVNRQRT